MLSQAAWRRGIVRRLLESLANTPVVLLNAPRQSGKSYSMAFYSQKIPSPAHR
jgi:predicted AAA+ superfamily ATPase